LREDRGCFLLPSSLFAGEWTSTSDFQAFSAARFAEATSGPLSHLRNRFFPPLFPTSLGRFSRSPFLSRNRFPPRAGLAESMMRSPFIFCVTKTRSGWPFLFPPLQGERNRGVPCRWQVFPSPFSKAERRFVSGFESLSSSGKDCSFSPFPEATLISIPTRAYVSRRRSLFFSLPP